MLAIAVRMSPPLVLVHVNLWVCAIWLMLCVSILLVLVLASWVLVRLSVLSFVWVPVVSLGSWGFRLALWLVLGVLGVFGWVAVAVWGLVGSGCA